MSLPLAPHKEQDRYRYVRVRQDGPRKGGGLFFYLDGWHVPYRDLPDQRVISSRRVESAVEAADYLALCIERGWVAERNSAGWCVSREQDMCDADREVCWGDTLRQAYHRFDARQPEVAAPTPAELEETYDSVDLEERLRGHVEIREGDFLREGDFCIGHKVYFSEPFPVKLGYGHAGVITKIRPGKLYTIQRPDGSLWFSDGAHLSHLDDGHDLQHVIDIWPRSDGE